MSQDQIKTPRSEDAPSRVSEHVREPAGRFMTHFGDPCLHCGTPLDDVKPGSCEGDRSKAIVIGYCSLGVRWDGVEHFRFRTSDNDVHEVHRHISEHAPYYHFGRRQELSSPPRYDERLKTLAGSRTASQAPGKDALASDLNQNPALAKQSGRGE